MAFGIAGFSFAFEMIGKSKHVFPKCCFFHINPMLEWITQKTPAKNNSKWLQILATTMVLIQKQSWKIMKSKSQQLRFIVRWLENITKKIFLQNDGFFHGDEFDGIKSEKITWKNKQTQVNKVSTPKETKKIAQKSWKVNPKKGSQREEEKKSIPKKINLDVSKNRGTPNGWRK